MLVLIKNPREKDYYTIPDKVYTSYKYDLCIFNYDYNIEDNITIYLIDTYLQKNESCIHIIKLDYSLITKKIQIQLNFQKSGEKNNYRLIVADSDKILFKSTCFRILSRKIKQEKSKTIIKKNKIKKPIKLSDLFEENTIEI
jgi:hypothetical protein